ncbi:PRD domain-containing protein [Selenomonas montiformis]|uniref:PRD domain-containing protein n=1 Tax=Selenomonas montiformis TaxID=2652285 RepID=UPI0012B56344|nr:PRD domain-containing protein [Selenomonas montiformis]
MIIEGKDAIVKIERIYNNNVILAHDDKNEEIIAIGKGLAFSRHVGDTIEKDRIEKLFILRDKSIQSKLQAILSDIPSVYLEIVEELIQEIHATSNLTLNESIYLTLTDHISVSLEREKQGLLCRNPLLPEIKQFYPQEYRLARLAVGIIRRYLQVTISDDEVGFITLHIVNASVNQQMMVTVKATRMVRDILTIIRQAFPDKIEAKPLLYQRLVRHLQIFTRTLLTVEKIEDNSNYFYKLGKTQYSDAYRCVKTINHYVKEKTGKTITDGEQGYLLLHIINLIYS